MNDRDKGRAVVQHWREVLGKDPSYSPSCDHDNGRAVIVGQLKASIGQVIAYIDSLIEQTAEADRRTDIVRGSLEFTRQRVDELEADRLHLMRRAWDLEVLLVKRSQCGPGGCPHASQTAT